LCLKYDGQSLVCVRNSTNVWFILTVDSDNCNVTLNMYDMLDMARRGVREEEDVLRFDGGFERFRVRRLRIHNHSVWREKSPESALVSL